ncbi:MAG: tyrosine-type recombinase/integrase [Acidobacteria bacterium]|nr:tyrosine-type recombinase/integrase [Acidobacteriota bacterium]
MTGRRKSDALTAELEIETEKKNASFGIFKQAQTKPVTLKELLDRHKATYTKHHRLTLAKRVYSDFLALLPEDFLAVKLKPAHFHDYAAMRLKTVVGKTVNHEFGVISPALIAAHLYFPQLEDWHLPRIPRIPNSNKRRERIVTDDEQTKLLDYLRRAREKGELDKNYFHRQRLADWIEFGAWTGFRRKEIAALRKSSFDAEQQALLNVWRFKTDKPTPFFPLSRRAAEIIEQRITFSSDSEYIFTGDGKPVPSHYRTLKEVCAKLKITYGRKVIGGFILHDLKRNFASNMQQVTDIATLQELTSNSSDSLNVYLNTSRKQMREAMRRMENVDLDAELKLIYKEAKARKMTEEAFVEAVKNLIR